MRKGVATAAILARALHHSRSLPPSPLPTEGLPTRVPSSLKTTKPKSNDDSPLLLHSSHPHLVFLISFPHLVFLRRRRFKRICHGGNNRAAAALSPSVCTPQAKNTVKGCMIEAETSETFDHVLQTSE